MLNINPEKYKSENLLSEEDLLPILEELKKAGKKIGLCTGSYDLLHPGHITHLESAKKQCDILVVGIAEDKYSMNKNHGTGRPVFSQELRAFIISKLKCVDFVIFDKAFDLSLLYKIKPNLYIKGRDFAEDKNKERDRKDTINALNSYGGKMYITPDEKLSTTDILKHIKDKINL